MGKYLGLGVQPHRVAVISIERAAVKHENWLAALALALMLPDICAEIEWPGKKGGKRYAKRWENRFANTYRYATGPSDYVTGKEIYRLRCAYLHEGSEVQSDKKKISTVIERFRFDASRQHHLKEEKTQNQKTIVWLDAGTFCLDMCSQVADWEKNILSQNPRMQKSAEKLLKIYTLISPSGISSTTVFGIPTVTQSE